MGLSLLICKNEIERFNLLKENYNGNLPEILIRVNFHLPLSSEFAPIIQLDYGSFGISVCKSIFINYLLSLENIISIWHIKN